MAIPDKLTPLQALEARRTAGKDKPTRAISEAEKATRRDRVPMHLRIQYLDGSLPLARNANSTSNELALRKRVKRTGTAR